MSVHQLKDGRWFVQYRNPDSPPAFKREYFGRGLEGEQRARERNEELNLRPVTRVPDSDEKTFAHMAQAYLEAKLGHMEDTTYDRLMIKLQNVIIPEIGQAEVRRLTPHRIDQYVNKRLRAPVKKVTVNGEVTYIQAILNWAVGRKYIRVNPLAGYKKPRRDDEVIQPVTADEMKRILKKSPPHLARALALSYYTGLRPGLKELLRLKWSDIDWTLNVILVRSARKKGPAARMIPIHRKFLPALRGWYKQDLSAKEEQKKSPNARQEENDFIITYKGKAVDRISKAFATAKKNAGITRKLPPYAFRHSFVTNLLGAGGDLKATSEIAGHSRTDTTTRIYQHTNLTLKQTVINKLPPLDFPGSDS